MGAWIEIVVISVHHFKEVVAPYMGAWIEIQQSSRIKSDKLVAPYMGAWIEIITLGGVLVKENSRTLHGCVD